MATITAEYIGNLQLTATHTQSGATLTTDAPTDNGGKGEHFSPTDLCATSLATCAMTIIGLYADSHGLDVVGTKIDIVKVMSQNPRRIAKIEITMYMPKNNYSDKDKKAMQNCMNACPVHHSLHPDVEKVFNIIW